MAHKLQRTTVPPEAGHYLTGGKRVTCSCGWKSPVVWNSHGSQLSELASYEAHHNRATIEEARNETSRNQS